MCTEWFKERKGFLNCVVTSFFKLALSCIPKPVEGFQNSSDKAAEAWLLCAISSVRRCLQTTNAALKTLWLEYTAGTGISEP